MDIDQAIISKIERHERKATRAQVLKFAEIYNLDVEELIVAWLSDKVAYDLIEERNAEQILKVAEKKVKFFKNK